MLSNRSVCSYIGVLQSDNDCIIFTCVFSRQFIAGFSRRVLSPTNVMINGVLHDIVCVNPGIDGAVDWTGFDFPGVAGRGYHEDGRNNKNLLHFKFHSICRVTERGLHLFKLVIRFVCRIESALSRVINDIPGSVEFLKRSALPTLSR
jgi:hypothetical protein